MHCQASVRLHDKMTSFVSKNKAAQMHGSSSIYMSSYMAIPRLSAAEVLYGSSEGKLLLILDICKIGFLLLLVFLLLYVGFIGITSLWNDKNTYIRGLYIVSCVKMICQWLEDLLLQIWGNLLLLWNLLILRLNSCKYLRILHKMVTFSYFSYLVILSSKCSNM